VLRAVRDLELGLVGLAAGLVAVVLWQYMRAYRRVAMYGLTWLGLKVAHVILVALAYECGCAFIWLEVWQRDSRSAPFTYRVVLGLLYGALGVASQLLILTYERRGGSVGAYAERGDHDD
jgi:hypothetical protein